ncbi:MAG TPA: GNAT family N-acetyltransferase [Kineosporiaceae bacterium]|nr:GNAT family N-acetyltransferase [Kineosporiaceae bacterium]
MPEVTVHLVEDPRVVKRHAAGWLARHAVEANVPATLLVRDLRRADAGEASTSSWALAVAGGELVALGMHTPGYSAQLAGADAEVAVRLADAWHAAGRELTGVAGAGDAAAAFARRWEVLTGARVGLGMREGLHVLDVLVPATGVPGAGRLAGPADVDLVVRWLEDFGAEALPHLPPLDPAVVRARVEHGSFVLWEDGRPVSLAGFRTAGGVGRVGPVWTPPEHRRRGYAAAVTTAATRAILDAGALPVLYTDLANPTSNGVYRRLGYRMVAETAEWVFAA